MKLHYFNPENDIALGLPAGQRLTMSPMVSALHDSGALLPMWYSDADDRILVDGGFDREFVERMARDFGLNARPVSKSDAQDVVGAPWGWSYDSACKLSAAGAQVPGRSVIERIRMLSHRRTSIEILKLLENKVDFSLPPLPVEVYDTACIPDLLDKWGAVYVKQPWSSSGRGVFRVAKWTDSIESRVSGMIRKQGSVMVEAEFPKKGDFAMLFSSVSGVAKFAGYSLFFNDIRDSYGGNLLAPDEFIERHLVSMGASARQLAELKSALSEILTELISPVYDGYMGIDMMVGHDGSIAPCVELNLRMTMGVVASIFRDRYLDADSLGIFRVRRVTNEVEQSTRYEIKEARLRSGCVCLTPPSANGFVYSVEAFPPESGSLEFQQLLK